MSLINENVRSEGLLQTRSLRFEKLEITTAASTYSMSASTPHYINFEGSTAGQSLDLPDATTLSNGHQYYITNEAGASVSLRYNDTSILVNLVQGSRTTVTLKDNSTVNGLWIYESSSASSISSYSFFGSYNGNANTGRYLEIYPKEASEDAPYIVVFSSAIVAVSLGATSVSTGTVGIFETGDLVTPIQSISLANQAVNTLTGLFVTLAAGNQVAMRVTSGSISKPHCTIYITGT